jgi:hypothetical protein
VLHSFFLQVVLLPKKGTPHDGDDIDEIDDDDQTNGETSALPICGNDPSCDLSFVVDQATSNGYDVSELILRPTKQI